MRKIWLILISTVILLLLSKFKLSKSISAIGSSERNAFASGIQVEKTKVLTYTLGGMLAFFSGIKPDSINSFRRCTNWRSLCFTVYSSSYNRGHINSRKMA
jgi:branched-subunit amino acid ABC-type transport system permease component